MKNYTSLSAQKGMTFWGIAMLIVVFVVGGRLLMSTVPPYLEDRAISSLVQEKLASNPNASVKEVYALINRQLQIDQSDMKPDDIFTVKSDNPGNIILAKDYQVTAPLFGHISVVNHFQGEIRQKP